MGEAMNWLFFVKLALAAWFWAVVLIFVWVGL